MKCVIVTPAGRQRYLELLFQHLIAQKDDFDEWRLWINTAVQSDIDYCRKLESENTWIKCVIVPSSNYTSFNICNFFKTCTDIDTVYIRLDDDIVWLEPGFVSSIKRFRIANPDFFLVYGNIINNAITSHLQQRFLNITLDQGIAGYLCMDDVGWKSPAFSEHLHRSFIRDCKLGKHAQWKFSPWVLFFNERVSINCISWLGSEFAKFDGAVGTDEEAWLSIDKPKQLQKLNCIHGGALCVHFSFYTQRAHLDQTNILDEYRSLI